MHTTIIEGVCQGRMVVLIYVLEMADRQSACTVENVRLKYLNNQYTNVHNHMNASKEAQ